MNKNSLPGDATDDGDLIEFMTAVIMAESGRTGACPTPTTTAITPRRVTPSTPTISTGAAAPKRLDQSLGAGRHSTKVIQPIWSRSLSANRLLARPNRLAVVPSINLWWGASVDGSTGLTAAAGVTDLRPSNFSLSSQPDPEVPFCSNRGPRSSPLHKNWTLPARAQD